MKATNNNPRDTELIRAQLCRRHINPGRTIGGWVALTASTDDTVWIGYDAKVLDNAKVSDKAWVLDNVEVLDNARVSDEAYVFGDVRVAGTAEVCGAVMIWGDAVLTRGVISG